MIKISEEEYEEYSKYFDSLKERIENGEESNTAMVSAGVLFLVSAIKTVQNDTDDTRRMAIMDISERLNKFFETAIYTDEKALALTEAFLMDIKLVCSTTNGNIKVN